VACEATEPVALDAEPPDAETGNSDCSACDPPRNGQFCGYTPGCGANVSALACHFDGSGDGGLGFACGCDGVTFTPTRYGGEDGVWAVDRPFAHWGACEDAGTPDTGAGDAGMCAACDPARDGLFCGYTAGCGVNTPALACHRDGSGDAVAIEFCGCDGVTFVASRQGGSSEWAADRPFAHLGPCSSTDGGLDASIPE